MLTDNTGANNANLRRYDYLPFGQQIPSGVDGRTTGMGYTITPDVTDPKFTGEVPGSGDDFGLARGTGNMKAGRRGDSERGPGQRGCPCG